MSRINGKLILFSCLVTPPLLLIYGIVNSQGMRMSISTLATKIYKIPLPGFSYLQHLKNIRDLDLAHVLAMFMLMAVWILTTAVVEIHLFCVQRDERLNISKHVRFLISLAAMVLICDVAMFYRGISDSQGGLLDAAGGVTPIIATVGYSALLAFVAYFHVMLKHRIF